MNKILITTSSFDVTTNPYLKTLESSGYEIICNPFGRRLTEEEVKGLLQDDVIGIIAGVEPLTKAVLESAKNLKVISRCGIGMDSVDIPAALKLGMHVDNTPNGPVVAVAELTLTLILSLLRRIAEADRNIRGRAWKPLMGNLLSAQTVGVVGYGRIGKRVCQLLRAFGSKVIVYDKQEVSLEKDYEFYPMDDLIEIADVISLHIPHDDSTHHIINRERMLRMKQGAKLVNASRGGLIDEDDLYEVLQSGHLAGAALDTFEKEPYTGPLTSMNQVVLTSHMGSYAKEARRLMEQDAGKNLLQGLVSKGMIKAEAYNNKQ